MKLIHHNPKKKKTTTTTEVGILMPKNGKVIGQSLSVYYYNYYINMYCCRCCFGDSYYVHGSLYTKS